ncbi:hypothetical protein V6N12_066398 [Hibiscus sabdariffa]|uniref:Uncharacterized protein n=1 Tax=Hibiscus sabdariffa TaxID=183260 RepID=A0ABR2CPZ5_9ROSI
MWGKCRRLRPVMCVAWKVGGGEEYLQILQHCSIGWCQVLISNSSLVDEMRLEKVSGVHVMRISRPLVLLIFDSIEIQQQVVSSDVLKIWFSRVVDWNETDCALDYCSVTMIEEAMLEFSSFERGRVLIETTVIDRIEERLELSVSGHVFSIRILEADTLLRGPRGYYSMRDQSSSSEDLVSDKEEEQIDQKDGQSCAHEGVASAMRVDEQLADGAEECDEPILEGSNAEVIISNGHKRKVQLLTDVIHSLQSLEGEVTSDEGDSMAGSWASS